MSKRKTRRTQPARSQSRLASQNRPDGRPAQQFGSPGRPAQSAQTESAASKLFDLRILIGGLFTVYGLILIVAGLLASAAERQKAAGININLWMGIGMLVLGLLFLLWWRRQPLRPPGAAARR